MWFDLGKYLQPTPSLRELQILVHLSEHPETSQAELAHLIGLAPAMVNTYLRRLAAEGLIEPLPRNHRSFAYRLTPTGERRRMYHVITFLAEVYSLFGRALDDLKRRIVAACGTDPHRIVLYGAGETGQMAYLALRGVPQLTLIGVVDDDPAKVDSMFFEHRIGTPATIADLRPDKVILASWLHSDTMAQKVASIVEGLGIEIITLTP